VKKPARGDDRHASSGKQRGRTDRSATMRRHHLLHVVALRKRVVTSLTPARISRTTSSGRDTAAAGDSSMVLREICAHEDEI
jgi:hypothetical protein